MGWADVSGVTLLEEEAKNDVKGMVCGDIHDLPFADGEFDYVVSKETLEHLISPTIGLSEINRVMKLGGKFVHYIPSGMEKQRDWYHYNCFPDWLWVDFFYKGGFEVESIIKDIQQLRYEGTKMKPAGWMTRPYDLNAYYNGIKKC